MLRRTCPDGEHSVNQVYPHVSDTFRGTCREFRSVHNTADMSSTVVKREAEEAPEATPPLLKKKPGWQHPQHHQPHDASLVYDWEENFAIDLVIAMLEHECASQPTLLHEKIASLMPFCMFLELVYSSHLFRSVQIAECGADSLATSD